MKKLLALAVLVGAAALSSCKCDNDDLWNSVHGLEERVARLEELCKRMNADISSLQTIVTALQLNDCVTGVAPVMQGGKEVGYTITFGKSSPITIYHGKDGLNGADGADGKDGATPAIGVRLDTDGRYYWTLDGEWLTDRNGNRIKAEGTDGKDGAAGADGGDGADGSNGKDGITPRFKIEDGYWFISYDEGNAWTQLGKAVGEDGKDGVSSDSIFSDIDCTSSADYVIFTLSDGTRIKLPTWSAFEALQRLCNETNTNLEALRTIVEGLLKRDYITDVLPLTENGAIVGYTIRFAKSNPVVIYNGRDGRDGATPVIGVRQDADGRYYWTLDGEWLTDGGGRKVQAQGQDGADGMPGQDGADGRDGITPQLKIVSGYWHISYDGGESWTQLGKAAGEDGKDGADGKPGADGKDAENIRIAQDEDFVYFTLADGTVIKVPKNCPCGEKNIRFVCPVVKAICVENWDTNGDGELSYDEAAAVRDIDPNVFSGKKQDIESFDELQYFTGISEIESGSFMNFAKLVSIKLPEQVIRIGDWAFFCCPKLKHINISDKVINIGHSAFYGCQSLTTICIPAAVDSIGGRAFGFCNKLERFEGPHASSDQRCLIMGNTLCAFAPAGLSLGNLVYTVESRVNVIGNGAFYGCQGIPQILIPNLDSVEDQAFMGSDVRTVFLFDSSFEIGEQAFDHCSDFTGFKNAAYGEISISTSNIGDRAFAHCSDLISIMFDDVVSIGDGVFENCGNLTSFEIPASVVRIGNFVFKDCQNLTEIRCKATVPPACPSYCGEPLSLLGDLEPGVCIYVPSGGESEYRSSAGWSDYASQIVGCDF